MIAFTLRDATPADTPDIARLVKALAEYENLSHEARATAHDFETQLFGENPIAHAIIAHVEKNAVGLALYHFNFSTFLCRPGLYLEDIFVEAAHRGHGIGRAFFRALAQRAIARDCGRMEWAVLDWNEPAIEFYRSLGAVGLDDWTIQRLTAESIASLAKEDTHA